MSKLVSLLTPRPEGTPKIYRTAITRNEWARRRGRFYERISTILMGIAGALVVGAIVGGFVLLYFDPPDPVGVVVLSFFVVGLFLGIVGGAFGNGAETLRKSWKLPTQHKLWQLADRASALARTWLGIAEPSDVKDHSPVVENHLQEIRNILMAGTLPDKDARARRWSNDEVLRLTKQSPTQLESMMRTHLAHLELLAEAAIRCSAVQEEDSCSLGRDLDEQRYPQDLASVEAALQALIEAYALYRERAQVLGLVDEMSNAEDVKWGAPPGKDWDPARDPLLPPPAAEALRAHRDCSDDLHGEEMELFAAELFSVATALRNVQERLADAENAANRTMDVVVLEQYDTALIAQVVSDAFIRYSATDAAYRRMRAGSDDGQDA